MLQPRQRRFLTPLGAQARRMVVVLALRSLPEIRSIAEACKSRMRSADGGQS